MRQVSLTLAFVVSTIAGAANAQTSLPSPRPADAASTPATVGTVSDGRARFAFPVDRPGIMLTLPDATTSLSGRIVTGEDQPAPACFIAVFTVDPALWRPQAPRVRSARTATDGSWIVDGLPAGEYYVAALMDVGAEDLGDPAFLHALQAVAVRLSLAEGEKRTQDFRINPGSGLRARFDPGGR